MTPNASLFASALCLTLALCGCGPSAVERQKQKQQAEQEQQEEKYRQARLGYDRIKKAELAQEMKQQQQRSEALDLLAQGRRFEAGGRLRAAFDNYRQALQALPSGHPEDERAMREAVISAAVKLDPPPAVPRQARDQALRAEERLRLVTDDEGMDKTLRDYESALQLAPWWADAWFNQALVLEKTQRYAKAREAFRLFLLAAPGSPEEASVQRRILALEVQEEQLRPTTRLVGSWSEEGADGRLYGDFEMMRKGATITLKSRESGEKKFEGTVKNSTFNGTYFAITPASALDPLRPYCSADFLEQARRQTVPITAAINEDGSRLTFRLLTPAISIQGGNCRYEGNYQFDKIFVRVLSDN